MMDDWISGRTAGVLVLFLFARIVGTTGQVTITWTIKCGWDGVSKKVVTSWSSMIGICSPCRSFAHHSTLPNSVAVFVPFFA
jgi:hypothetical protein